MFIHVKNVKNYFLELFIFTIVTRHHYYFVTRHFPTPWVFLLTGLFNFEATLIIVIVQHTLFRKVKIVYMEQLRNFEFISI